MARRYTPPSPAAVFLQADYQENGSEPHAYTARLPEIRVRATLSRFQSILREHRLDGFFVTTPQNFRYFTGFASQFWEIPTRPCFAIIPAEGMPIAVIPAFDATVMARHGLAISAPGRPRCWRMTA